VIAGFGGLNKLLPVILSELNISMCLQTGSSHITLFHMVVAHFPPNIESL
jgi:hypothetical protein